MSTCSLHVGQMYVGPILKSCDIDFYRKNMFQQKHEEARALNIKWVFQWIHIGVQLNQSCRKVIFQKKQKTNNCRAIKTLPPPAKAVPFFCRSPQGQRSISNGFEALSEDFRSSLSRSGNPDAQGKTIIHVVIKCYLRTYAVTQVTDFI